MPLDRHAQSCASPFRVSRRVGELIQGVPSMVRPAILRTGNLRPIEESLAAARVGHKTERKPCGNSSLHLYSTSK